MSKITLFVTLISLSLLFNACSKKDKTATQDANSILSTNEFVLTGLDKKQYVVKKEPTGFSIDADKNKVIIFDIFGTWCPPCQAEASRLADLQKKYKNSLLVIGVTVGNNVPNSKLLDFRQEHGANYVLVNSSVNERFIEALATELHLGRDFGIPLMALYKNGKLINMFQGATEEEFIESDIKKALGH